MTTIVLKGNTMCGDGRMTLGDRVVSNKTVKVHKINGHLVGGAGRWGTLVKFFDWFADYSAAKDVQEGNPDIRVSFPAIEPAEDFVAMVLTPDMKIIQFEGSGTNYEMEEEDGFFAIGTGADAALGALHMGATAEESVEIACKLDCMSGGEITSIVLEPLLTEDDLKEMTKKDLLKVGFGIEYEDPEEDIQQTLEEVAKQAEETPVMLNDLPESEIENGCYTAETDLETEVNFEAQGDITLTPKVE